MRRFSIVGDGRYLVAVLYLCLAVCCYSQDIPEDTVTTEKLKQTVLAWADSLKTFSGEYTLSQTTYEYDHATEQMAEEDYFSWETFLEEYTLSQTSNEYDHATGQMAEESYSSWTVVLRQAQDNYYFKIENNSDETWKRRVETHTRYNGVQNYYSQPGFVNWPSHGVSNITDEEGLHYPWGFYLMPREIFGERQDYSLRDVLAQGRSRFITKNDHYILSHSNPQIQSAVDITINKDNFITKIEWVRRPSVVSEERLMAYWEGDVFDLRRKQTTLELKDYQHINGVSFPGSVIKTRWRVNESAVVESLDLYENEAISKDELEVLLLTTPVQAVCVQSFSLTNASINEPLSKEDFAIDWPEDVRIFDGQNMPQPGERIPDIPAERGLWFYMAIAGVVGLCILAGIVFYYKRYL
ncbi:MAG: hypothetical protein GX130_04620 [Candidatus Hydrogenedens sp.]|jgi:hypothetical protein|nr:hypothetical protein [Candidatus Hydrogenedens sp.]